MARREVIEVVCDRCKKVETQPTDGKKVVVPELKVNFQGEEHTYSDLCTRCRDTIKNYFKGMTLQKQSGSEVSNEQPASLGTPAPAKVASKIFGH
jgi:hypothetical protein